MTKKLRCKYCNKRLTTRDDHNIQSHDQEESKLNSTINANSGVHTLTSDNIIKTPSNKNNVATMKGKENFNSDLVTRTCRVRAMRPM